ncbi:hypothetical protein HMPREF0083_01761 [Aneurinibacillus aneurinilyticus ATCC 12856]|jgi:hypothetical protein|uniref:Uncharacterized protein n=1 Tax=Aneurinibacillus aneurinilyticus ATCC 12856 TaxID=649747 RepID=U1YDH4_ANEAE|nr:hypothetical protein HMPREF0083_01761 [Aneurinibacillus aneurinilyticus ATCC 12856]
MRDRGIRIIVAINNTLRIAKTEEIGGSRLIKISEAAKLSAAPKIAASPSKLLCKLTEVIPGPIRILSPIKPIMMLNRFFIFSFSSGTKSLTRIMVKIGVVPIRIAEILLIIR